MLGIQNSLSAKPCSTLSFKNSSPFDDLEKRGMNFDRSNLDSESAKKLDELDDFQNQLNDYADKFENSNSKHGKKVSKVIKFAAGVLGLAGVFILAKGGYKATIEGAKSFVKSDSVQSFVKHFDGVKSTASDVGKAAGDGIKSVWNSPKVQKVVADIQKSKPVKKFTDFIASEKGQKIVTPMRNAWESIKGTKLDANKVQNAVENTMAGITTASVGIKKIAGVDESNSDANVEQNASDFESEEV